MRHTYTVQIREVGTDEWQNAAAGLASLDLARESARRTISLMLQGSKRVRYESRVLECETHEEE